MDKVWGCVRQVFADGSSIAKKPLEVMFVYSPEKGEGVYAPPIVGVPSDALLGPDWLESLLITLFQP